MGANLLKSFISILFLFVICNLSAQGGLQVYNSIPGFDGYGSDLYLVEVREVSTEGIAFGDQKYSHCYYLESIAQNGAERMSHSHWTTFSFNPQGNSSKVEVSVSLQSESISSFEFRPSHVSDIKVSDGSLSFRIESNSYTTLIINGDIRNPLFIFCDPAETIVPDTTSAYVLVVKRGSTSFSDPLTITEPGFFPIRSNKSIYPEGLSCTVISGLPEQKTLG